MRTVANLLHQSLPALRPWPEKDALQHRIFCHGATTLANAELLAILLRSGHGGMGAIDVAHNLLERNGSDLLSLGSLSAFDLAQEPGMGRSKAANLVAAFEIARRRNAIDPAQRPLIASSVVAHDLLRPVLADLPHEEFWLLLLDRGNRLIERMRISQGGITGTVADPKVIFRAALKRRACCIVLAHNHPSGQLRPSEEDISLTRKLVAAGRLMDISMQDHLIVTQMGYYSFADQGMMQ